MKKVSYKDPYEPVAVIVQLEDDDAEGIEEVLAFLNDDARLTQNLKRKERYHTACHLEGLIYEGEDFAADMDVEAETMKKEMENLIDEWLHENLTEAQYRRFNLYMDGNSIREIARLEDADYSSVNESIKAAQKKLRKLYTPSNPPF